MVHGIFFCKHIGWQRAIHFVGGYLYHAYALFRGKTHKVRGSQHICAVKWRGVINGLIYHGLCCKIHDDINAIQIFKFHVVNIHFKESVAFVFNVAQARSVANHVGIYHCVGGFLQYKIDKFAANKPQAACNKYGHTVSSIPRVQGAFKCCTHLQLFNTSVVSIGVHFCPIGQKCTDSEIVLTKFIKKTLERIFVVYIPRGV